MNSPHFFSEHVLKIFSTLTQMPYHGVTGPQTGLRCEFTMAAVTKDHRLSGLHDGTVLSPSLEARGRGHGLSGAVLPLKLSCLLVVY